MDSFLTLAMSEAKPGQGEFTVVAGKENSGILAPIYLEKSEITSCDGSIYWDIGSVTRADVVKYIPKNTDTKNVGYKANHPEVIKKYDEYELKNFLLDRVGSYESFKSNQARFIIVKVKEVKNFNVAVINGTLKCRMDVVLTGSNDSVSLLNKDYRWVTYWQHVSDEEKEVCVNRYMTLLNRTDKTLFLILYKHYYSNGPAHWIAGMHLL